MKDGGRYRGVGKGSYERRSSSDDPISYPVPTLAQSPKAAQNNIKVNLSACHSNPKKVNRFCKVYIESKPSYLMFSGSCVSAFRILDEGWENSLWV